MPAAPAVERAEEWTVADPEALEWAVEVQGPQAAARADPAQAARVWEAAAREVQAPVRDQVKQGHRRAANKVLVLDRLPAKGALHGQQTFRKPLASQKGPLAQSLVVRLRCESTFSWLFACQVRWGNLTWEEMWFQNRLP